MERFQIPWGPPKTELLPWSQQPQLGRWHPGQCPSCSWIIPLLAQSPVWLGEQVSSLPSSWESPAASAEMEDPHHLPVLLAWPRHSLPCRVVPVSQILPCLQSSTSAAELRTRWALRQLDASQRLCPQNFQITLERWVKPNPTSSRTPTASLHTGLLLLMPFPASAPFLCLLAQWSQSQGRRHLLISPELCCRETSALGAAPMPPPWDTHKLPLLASLIRPGGTALSDQNVKTGN